MKSLKIDPEMVEKIWVFSSKTDVVPSSCLLSCALLSYVTLMLSWQWRAIKLMSLACDKIFKHFMFASLGAVLELGTPKIGLKITKITPIEPKKAFLGLLGALLALSWCYRRPILGVDSSMTAPREPNITCLKILSTVVV